MEKISCLLIALAIGICSCNNSSKSSELIALSDCPQKMDGLSVELSQNEDYVQTIKITKDGKMLQELKGEDDDLFFEGSPMDFNNSMVYYVDANYDGDIDIYIGTGEDRSKNTLLLWNSDKELFERYGKIGEPSLMNPYFSPSENAIYVCGSNGFFDFGYSKFIWENDVLVEQESLDEILFREGFDFDSYNEFNDYKRSKKYMLTDIKNNIIKETDNVDELPSNWAAVVSKQNSLSGISNDSNIKESNIMVEEKDAVEIVNTDSLMIEEDYDVASGGNYTIFGTSGTMRLEKTGYEGDPMSPNTYFAKYGNDGETILRFNCYPHSKFGKNDFAELTHCDNLKESIANVSFLVPSCVDLEGKLYKVDRVTLVSDGSRGYPTAGRIIIPSTVERIKIWGCDDLKEVVLNEGIEELNERAFRGCPDLESIVLPNTLKRLGKLAFENCNSLKKIHIPSSVNDVSEGAAFVGLNKGVIIEVEKSCKALNDLKPIKVEIRGRNGYEHYTFNPEDINIVYVE